jgi:hypothetical protein
LGLLSAKETDLDDIIHPLLQLLADTMVDYSIFFRTLCNFATSPKHVFQSQLIDTDVSEIKCNCLSLLLEALKNTSLSDDNLMGVSNESSNKENLLIENSVSEESDAIPTSAEITAKWKSWAEKYRLRALADSFSTRRQSIATEDLEKQHLMEDLNRQKRMKRANPKYLPRNWILKDLADKCLKEPALQPQRLPSPERKSRTAGLVNREGSSRPVSREMSEKMSVEGGFKDTETALRIMLEDIWGDISESETGWKSEIEKIISKTLADFPPDVSQTMKNIKT